MTLTVRLPLRVEQELAEYCVTRRISKSDAVKLALEKLMADQPATPSAYELGQAGFGTDRSAERDVARQSKRLLRERFGGKTAR